MKKEILTPEVREYFRLQGLKGASNGGKTAAANMTAEERTARAKKAATAPRKKRKPAPKKAT